MSAQTSSRPTRASASRLPAVAAALGTDATVDADTGRVSVPVTDGTHALADVVRNLDAAGLVVDDLGVRRPTLDEVFLVLTGAKQEAS